MCSLLSLSLFLSCAAVCSVVVPCSAPSLTRWSVYYCPAAKCTTACVGDATKKCGGFWLISVGELSPPGCASGTGGWLFVGALLGGFSGYLVGGVLFNMQSRGKPAGVQAIPNLEAWQALGGLVQDGVGFAQVSSQEIDYIDPGAWLVQAICCRLRRVGMF